MTAPDATAIACPNCDATTYAELSDGTVICLVCRTEWDPNDPPVRREPPAYVPLVTADSILGPPAGVDDSDDAQQWLDDAHGTQLVLEGGQVVTVVEIVDEDWVRVKMNDDREEVVNFADVVRSIPTPADITQAVDDVPDDAMRILTAVGGLLHAVALIARACNVSPVIVTNIIATYNDYELPTDAELLPIVLGDAIAALQMLADAFGLPSDTIATFASVEPNNADAAESESTT